MTEALVGHAHDRQGRHFVTVDVLTVGGRTWASALRLLANLKE